MYIILLPVLKTLFMFVVGESKYIYIYIYGVNIYIYIYV